MGLRDLANAGVADLLEGAADIIVHRGLAKGMRVNPLDGSVDIVAALAIAGGAHSRNILESRTRFDTTVPAIKEAALVIALDVLEAVLDYDPEEWADSPAVSEEDVVTLLRRSATRLRIAVV